MADHPEQYEILYIRTPARMKSALEKLAKNAGTDLTGYMNATVITNHLKEHDKSTIAYGAQSGQPGGSQ